MQKRRYHKVQEESDQILLHVCVGRYVFFCVAVSTLHLQCPLVVVVGKQQLDGQHLSRKIINR